MNKIIIKRAVGSIYGKVSLANNLHGTMWMSLGSSEYYTLWTQKEGEWIGLGSMQGCWWAKDLHKFAHHAREHNARWWIWE